VRAVVVVLVALGLVATATAVVSAATTVASPTITGQPANPTSNTDASFSFAGPSGAAFLCQLDTAVYATCKSPKTYKSLAQGAHVFRVKAVVKSVESAATSYTWSVDSVAPPAPSITAKPASLSNTTSPSFSFTDSEAGVTFRCRIDGSTYAACSSPLSYSGLAQGAHTFAVQAVDATGNVSSATSWSWTIDSIAPPAPVLDQKPSDPTAASSVTFSWSGSQAGVTFQCSLENGPWTPCATPYTYTIGTVNNQQHQFGVRALDTAGNISDGTFYQFKYVNGASSGVPFTITGSVGGLAIGVWRPIAITLTNPNPVDIYVTALSVTRASPNDPAVCPASANIELEQSNVSSVLRVTVPANSSVALPAPGVTAPRIRLMNLSTNQDACKSKSFALTYSGSATN
jgi:hypothetical protein